jgi:hypothetical protein
MDDHFGVKLDLHKFQTDLQLLATYKYFDSCSCLLVNWKPKWV